MQEEQTAPGITKDGEDRHALSEITTPAFQPKDSNKPSVDT
jgi:hypothetical protein